MAWPDWPWPPHFTTDLLHCLWILLANWNVCLFRSSRRRKLVVNIESVGTQNTRRERGIIKADRSSSDLRRLFPVVGGFSRAGRDSAGGQDTSSVLLSSSSCPRRRCKSNNQQRIFSRLSYHTATPFRPPLASCMASVVIAVIRFVGDRDRSPTAYRPYTAKTHALIVSFIFCSCTT